MPSDPAAVGAFMLRQLQTPTAPFAGQFVASSQPVSIAGLIRFPCTGIDQVRVGDDSSSPQSNNTGWGQRRLFASRTRIVNYGFEMHSGQPGFLHTKLGTVWRQDVSCNGTHTVRKHALGTRSIRIGDFCVVAVKVTTLSCCQSVVDILLNMNEANLFNVLLYIWDILAKAVAILGPQCHAPMALG